MIVVNIIKMRYFFLLLILFFSFEKNSWGENIVSEFLVAMPHMPDPRFKETVIFMLYHNQAEGAAGLVVNKPIEIIPISKLFRSSNITSPTKMIKKNITLHWGGPVQSEHIFFIHSSEYKSKDFIASNKAFTVTRSPDVLYDIAINKGPKKYIILSGIAVWSSGQLDSEMKQGDWDNKFNNYISLFDNDKEMWSRLISTQDI